MPKHMDKMKPRGFAKMGQEMKYEPKSTFTQKDYDKAIKAFSKQSMIEDKMEKIEAKDDNEMVNIGEGSMFTGNPYFDMGLSLGRRAAKNKKSK